MPTASGHTRAIRATTVLGTAVYSSNGDRLGTIEDVVLEKTSDNIMFAVIGFGGLMGIGEKYHPVPWSELTYSEELGGYTVDFTTDQLKSAPQDSIDELTKGDGEIYRNRAFEYYHTRPYWGDAPPPS